MDHEALRERAKTLPKEPGVYQFQSRERTLYVGKAVDLRSRIRSYTDPRSDRIARMVGEATDIEIAVTDTETQAVLLEANLIKRYQPRYNVRLTDDKSYPLVQLTNHEAPRIEITRDPDDDATVFGPFTNMGRVEMVVKAIREIYGLRGCSDHKYANRSRPCQDYEIGLCTAPCTNEIAEEAYLQDVESVKEFLEGATGVLEDPLKTQMDIATENLNFERAANIRDRLEAVRAFHSGGGEAVIDRHEDEDRVDVLGVSVQGDEARVSRLHAEAGKLVDRSRHVLDVPPGESGPEILASFIPQYYSERELPTSILLSEHIQDREVTNWLEAEGVEVSVPGHGREARLVDLALRNAKRDYATDDGVRKLKTELGLEAATRIEGFDVSHAQGKAVVGSNVTFENGQPDKSGYRRKKLADQNDDYENMYELIKWRAERAIEGRDDRPDPDLLLIDGGQGQLSAAQEALETTGWEIPVIALAKENEVVHSTNGKYDWDGSETHLHLLQRVRDEAHRFAVQYHQTVRDDVSTVLEDVPGVGAKRERQLLQRFGSVRNIRDASIEELTEVEGIGPQTAEALKAKLGSAG